MGLIPALPESLLALPADGSSLVHEVAAAGTGQDAQPKDSIKFSVIGLDHNHIYAMTAAVDPRRRRAGFRSMRPSPKQLADFHQRFGDVKLAASEDEILNDKSIQLVAGAPIPDLRAPLGIRAMRPARTICPTSRHHHARPARRRAQGDQGDRAQVRDHVFRTARSAARRSMAGRARQRRARSAAWSRPSISRRTASTRRPARLVLGQGALWRHPDRHRQPPGRSVPSITPAAPARRSSRRRPATSPIPTSAVRGFRRHDAHRQWRHRLCPRRLVHARRAADLGRRPALRARHRGLYRAAQIYRHRRACPAAITCSSPTGRACATSIAARSLCRSARNSSADIVERDTVAQDQDQALLAAELVLTAQKNATRPIMA